MENTQQSTSQQTQPISTGNVIQISTVDSVLGVVAILFAMGVAWGSLRTDVKSMKNSVEDMRRVVEQEIRPDIRNIRERLSVLEHLVAVLWKERSSFQTTFRQ